MTGRNVGPTGTSAATAPPPSEPSAHIQVHQRRIVRTAYLYILPAAIIMLVITFWPIIYQFWMSLTDFSNLNIRTSNLLLQIWGSFTGQTHTWNSPAFVGIRNYVDVLGGHLAEVLSGFDFWRILLFNLVWTIINLVLSVSIGVAIAVLLNQEGFRFKGFYRALYVIPWALPGLVSAMIWNNVFEKESGLLNQVLLGLGMQTRIGWLTQVDPPLPLIPPYVRVPDGVNPYLMLLLLLLLFIIPYFFRWVREHWLPFTIAWIAGLELFFLVALPPLANVIRGGAAAGGNVSLVGLGQILPLSFFAALITNVWLGWPFMMVISSGALQSIPHELYEAAEVDGASSWQTFRSLTMPLLRPAMVPAIIISMTWTFNQFNVLYFTTGGGPLHSTEILVTEAYRLVNQTTISLPGVGSVLPYGIAAAFAYIVFIVLATITVVTNRVARATESYAE